jgi:hypothetical protein
MRVDRRRINPRTLNRQLPQPLVQIDLTRLQEPHQARHITQQPGHTDLIQHRDISVDHPDEPVDHRRRTACHTPTRY